MSDVFNLVKYENAFNCSDCPGCNGTKGCPLWWEYPQEDPKSGDVRMIKTCGLPELPFFIRALITAANRPTEEFGKVGNEIVKAINGLQSMTDERLKSITNSGD